MALSLHHHAPRPHQVQHPMEAYRKKHQGFLERGGILALNEHVAVWTTDHVGTMWCAYVFCMIAAVTFWASIGQLGHLSGLVTTVGQIISQTFIQLVLLPVIIVGQKVEGRKGEVLAEEMYKGVMNSEHHEEEMIKHLSKQDMVMLVTLTGVAISLIVGGTGNAWQLFQRFTQRRRRRSGDQRRQAVQGNAS